MRVLSSVTVVWTCTLIMCTRILASEFSFDEFTDPRDKK